MIDEWWHHPKSYVIMDCLEGMKEIPDKSVDLVLTDPPYGIGVDYGATFEDTVDNVKSLVMKFLDEAERISDLIIFPSGKYEFEKILFKERPPVWRMCWYKGSTGHASPIGFCDWEMMMVYGNKVNKYVHDHFQTRTGFDVSGHPCPKPVEWSDWLIEKFTKPGDTILDPFLGSGTTLLSCRKLGRVGLGFEINPNYEDVIDRRINVTFEISSKENLDGLW
jgi:DNA modification methylase